MIAADPKRPYCARMTADRPLLGIAMMTGFCVLAPLGDAIAKLLGSSTPLVQLLLARFAVQAAILIPLAVVAGQSLRMKPRVFRLMLIRTLLHILGIAAMFMSLRFLPLADAVAIAFVMPFIMLILGHFVLQEEIGRFRMAACVVGFSGTLLVIQPSFVNVGAAALLPLVVAIVFALFMLVTRQIAKEVEAVPLQAVSGVFASIILLVMLLAARGSDIADLRLIALDSNTLWLLMAIGIVGTIAHLLMTWSLKFAPAATLAPMQYLEIPMATLFGWLLFFDFPNGLAAVGIAITVSAGLVVILREQSLAKGLKSIA